MPGWNEPYAFERLREHKATVAGAAGSNEATTRLRAINTLLFDVLGWDKLDVDAELYCRARGFADYALKDETSICLIVVAWLPHLSHTTDERPPAGIRQQYQQPREKMAR